MKKKHQAGLHQTPSWALLFAECIVILGVWKVYLENTPLKGVFFI